MNKNIRKQTNLFACVIVYSIIFFAELYLLITARDFLSIMIIALLLYINGMFYAQSFMDIKYPELGMIRYAKETIEEKL